jgi:hypothetical protein
MHIEEIAYQGWSRALRLSNASIDLIATLAVGPRLLRFGFVGGENQFIEFPEQLGQTGGDTFRIYGGHRLWHAPEHPIRTYYADNASVDWQPLPDGSVLLTQAVEPSTGVQKEMRITLPDDSPCAIVTHRLTNCGAWPIELAPWAITQMALGGEAVLPLPEKRSHSAELLPATSIAIWPYTDLTDARLSLGRDAIRITHAPGDEASAPPLKIGLFNPHGWAAYDRNGVRFVKRFTPRPGLPHPDFGCNSEVFTRFDMIELETLGPLERIAPGESVVHEETWTLTGK